MPVGLSPLVREEWGEALSEVNVTEIMCAALFSFGRGGRGGGTLFRAEKSVYELKNQKSKLPIRVKWVGSSVSSAARLRGFICCTYHFHTGHIRNS